MGKGIALSEFKECLNKGKIKKFGAAKALIPKELESARGDLKSAMDSFKDDNFKWATIQAYYAMFHTARMLIYSKGYRERSHFCLIVTMRALFVDEGLLEVGFVEAIQTAKTLRENADYENDFSASSAQVLLKKAEAFLKRAEAILKDD